MTAREQEIHDMYAALEQARDERIESARLRRESAELTRRIHETIERILR